MHLGHPAEFPLFFCWDVSTSDFQFQAEIKKAFKRRALELHPDKGGDADRFRLLQDGFPPKNSQDHSIPWTAYRYLDEFLPERRCEICWWSQSRIPWKALRIDAGSSMLKVMFGIMFGIWNHVWNPENILISGGF